MERDFASAREALDESVQLSGGETATGVFALAWLAMISLREGDEEEAFRHAQRARVVAERPGMRNYMPSIGAYSVVAHLPSRRGDLGGAARACDRVNELLPRLTEAYWWQMIETRILLAPALAVLGRHEEARTRLNEAEALLAEHRDAGTLHERYAETVRKLHFDARRPASPSHELSDAERRILRLLASDLSLRDIGRELFLSMNTVKTHKRSIYRKLGVSSRSDAVRAARIEVKGVHRDARA